MGRRLFGTDGVRGPVGSVLTDALARSLGNAAVAELGNPGVRLLVIRDTRESGLSLSAALAAGAAAAGANVDDGGVLPTPAAPLLIRAGDYDIAAVISASHNPYQDNGIKLFGAGGFKLTDEQEAAIEERVLSDASEHEAPEPGVVRELGGLGDRYGDALRSRFAALDLRGRRLGIDCAHGATFEVAPAIFQALGAEIDVIGAAPDGRNINAGCGSTDTAALSALVRQRGLDGGFAFDGDGDRLIAIGPDGAAIDGDELIGQMAAALHAEGALTGNGVAVTVMSNLGLRNAMEERGIAVATTPVGDRNVLAELRERGWRLGGEQSGHIIDMDFVPSGDGVASALLLLESLGSARLGETTVVHPLPQVLVNVPVRDRDAAMADSAILEAVRAHTEALAGAGRVLVRASGTEQLVRVMVEAPGADQANGVCDALVALVASTHGP